MKVLVVPVLLAAVGLATPDDWLADTPPAGFELVDEGTGVMSFEEYAALSPETVEHVAADSNAARDMIATSDLWESGADDFLLREITRWGRDGDAQAFVDQVAAVAIADDLDLVDAPFDGATAFRGGDDGLWTRIVVWQAGRYGVRVSYFSVDPSSPSAIAASDDATNAAARQLATVIASAAGVDDVTATTVGDTEATTSTGGGIPIVNVLFWIMLFIGAIWLFRKVRAARSRGPRGKHRDDGDGPDDTSADGETDVDDVIERARARARAERDVEAASGAELGDGWKLPGSE